MATAEGDCISVGNVVLSLSAIFGQLHCISAKNIPQTQKTSSSHTRSLYRTDNNVNLLSLRALPSICFLKLSDLRTPQILYLIVTNFADFYFKKVLLIFIL